MTSEQSQIGFTFYTYVIMYILAVYFDVYHTRWSTNHDNSKMQVSTKKQWTQMNT